MQTLPACFFLGLDARYFPLDGVFGVDGDLHLLRGGVVFALLGSALLSSPGQFVLHLRDVIESALVLLPLPPQRFVRLELEFGESKSTKAITNRPNCMFVLKNIDDVQHG